MFAYQFTVESVVHAICRLPWPPIVANQENAPCTVLERLDFDELGDPVFVHRPAVAGPALARHDFQPVFELIPLRR